ncbi:MFS transporter [Marinomonas sp. TI.3.20]|uniref:MFS transporter n=1 Tax=Marinomonas sp. TI.3.20 TaxID=3121296 RepID=UPI00311E4615
MKKYLIEGILFLTYVLFAFAWAGSSIMSPEIMKTFDTGGLTMIAMATNMIAIAKIVGNIFAAWFLVKLGPKNVFTMASILVILGGMGAFASSYNLYLLSRLILGFGGALVLVVTAPIVMNTFKEPKSRMVANALNADAFNTGNLIAVLGVGALMTLAGSWQTTMLTMAGLSAIAMLVWLFVGTNFDITKKDDGTSARGYTMKEGLKEKFNWTIAIGYSGLLFCYISVFTLFPNIPGFAIESKYLSSIMIAGGMIGTTVGVFVVPKFIPQRVKALRWFGLGITAFAAIAVTTSIPSLAMAAGLMCGVCMFSPMSSLLTMMQEQSDTFPARVAIAAGIFWSAAYVLEMIYMTIATSIADSMNNPLVAAFIAVGMSSTIFLSSFFLKETNNKQTN